MMETSELLQLAKVRPWGTILLGRHVRCDGSGVIEQDKARRLSCFTHIHTDHAKGFEDSLSDSEYVLVSMETKELLTATHPELRKRSNLEGMNFCKPYEYKSDTITFLPAGHILGSAQVLVESDGKRILYSGDFNLPGATIIVGVYVLLIDSTHGEPTYKTQSSPERQLDYIVKLANNELRMGRPVIIHTARGKIQYLMHHLRNHLPATIPFVSNTTDVKLAKTYTKFGMPCEDPYSELVVENTERFEMIKNNAEPYIYFMSSWRPSFNMSDSDETRTIHVGYPGSSSNPDKNVYKVDLSDHADYDGILEYVSRLNPQLVITDNSNRTTSKQTAVNLAGAIKSTLGIEALPQGKPL